MFLLIGRIYDVISSFALPDCSFPFFFFPMYCNVLGDWIFLLLQV